MGIYNYLRGIKMETNNFNEKNSNDDTAKKAAEIYTEMAEKNRPPKVRRVGTFTMGVALIVFGVLLFKSIITNNFEWQLMTKVAPILLILVGVEVLINYFFIKAEKLKYDILSVFVCFILISGAFCISLIGPIASYYGPERWYKEKETTDRVEDELYNKLSDIDYIRDATVYLSLNPMTINSVGNTDYFCEYARATVTLKNDFDSKESFAAASKAILERIQNIEPNFDTIEITSRKDGSNQHYTVDISSKFQKNLDIDGLVEIVYAYDNNGNYIESEYEESSEENVDNEY